MGLFKPLPSYPTSAWGATKVNRGDFFGSSNYQQGGEVISPQAFGFTGVERFTVELSSNNNNDRSYSYTGNYFGVTQYPANLSTANEQYAPVYAGTASNNQIVVRWFYAANSVEVANNTNLAAEALPVTVFGC
jgi:hypothetical protein